MKGPVMLLLGDFDDLHAAALTIGAGRKLAYTAMFDSEDSLKTYVHSIDGFLTFNELLTAEQEERRTYDYTS